jgi:hypothetical protein
MVITPSHAFRLIRLSVYDSHSGLHHSHRSAVSNSQEATTVVILHLFGFSRGGVCGLLSIISKRKEYLFDCIPVIVFFLHYYQKKFAILLFWQLSRLTAYYFTKNKLSRYFQKYCSTICRSCNFYINKRNCIGFQLTIRKIIAIKIMNNPLLCIRDRLNLGLNNIAIITIHFRGNNFWLYRKLLFFILSPLPSHL